MFRFLTKWWGGSQKQEQDPNRAVCLTVSEVGDKVVFPLWASGGDGKAIFWPRTQRTIPSSPSHIHGGEPFETDTEKPMRSYITTGFGNENIVFYCECGLRISFPLNSSFSKQELEERFAQWNLALHKSAAA